VQSDSSPPINETRQTKSKLLHVMRLSDQPIAAARIASAYARTPPKPLRSRNFLLYSADIQIPQGFLSRSRTGFHYALCAKISILRYPAQWVAQSKSSKLQVLMRIASAN
jgi:hypothetical protein